MSILIKGMNMPAKGEYELLLFCFSDDTASVTGATTFIKGEPFEVIEVPTPHGILVDADNLVSVIDDEFTEQTRTLSNPIKVLNKAVLCGFAKDVITAAPTIIEAEEGANNAPEKG